MNKEKKQLIQSTEKLLNWGITVMALLAALLWAYRNVFFGTMLCLLGSVASGCSGRMYVGWDRTDTVQETRTMEPKPVWCALFNCDNEGNIIRNTK